MLSFLFKYTMLTQHLDLGSTSSSNHWTPPVCCAWRARVSQADWRWQWWGNKPSGRFFCVGWNSWNRLRQQLREWKVAAATQMASPLFRFFLPFVRAERNEGALASPAGAFVFDCRELLSAKELSDEDVDHQLGWSNVTCPPPASSLSAHAGWSIAVHKRLPPGVVCQI